MPTTPTGYLGLAIDAVGETLKNLTEFQTFVGAADATAAKARVYPIGARTFTRPCVFVSLVNATSTPGGFWDITARLIFERETDAAYRKDGAEASDDTSAAYAFLNVLDPVITSLIEREHSGGIAIRQPGVLSQSAVMRSDKDDPVDFHQSVWVVNFGITIYT